MVRTENTSSAMSSPTRLPSTVGSLSTFLVTDCQRMRVPVTVGFLAHEDTMQLFWPPFDGVIRWLGSGG